MRPVLYNILLYSKIAHLHVQPICTLYLVYIYVYVMFLFHMFCFIVILILILYWTLTFPVIACTLYVPSESSAFSGKVCSSFNINNSPVQKSRSIKKGSGVEELDWLQPHRMHLGLIAMPTVSFIWPELKSCGWMWANPLGQTPEERGGCYISILIPMFLKWSFKNHVQQ